MPVRSTQYVNFGEPLGCMPMHWDFSVAVSSRLFDWTLWIN